MKILPDYLIQYMPEIEEAIEELRLSVIDHAYEMMQCLDVDELTSDEIRRKLELYDVKVENMSNEWLPNGRFYRLYPYIKHHRTRLNTLKAISTSGGQFEGLWSNDYSNKTTYNYNMIQLMRHYDLRSPLDGYFYVSGNVDRSSVNTINSSAVIALDSDILMSQALPAGYTYLYIPWPRPSYPSDSSYFYQVHMLDYDRLEYTRLCDRIDEWELVDESTGIYFNRNNSFDNRYYSTITCKYGSDINSIDHYFNSTVDDNNNHDNPFPDTHSKPASLSYDWKNGIGTPYRTPYWFDYHYMNNVAPYHSDSQIIPHIDGVEQTDTDPITLSTWPITEYGKYVYYDDYGDEIQTDNPADATIYKLYDECSELSSTKSVFPTNCYLHTRNKTTPTNREVGIKYAYNEYQIQINNTPDPTKLDSIKQIILNETYLDVYTISDRLNNTPCILCSYIDKNKADYIVNLINSLDNIAEMITMVDPENDVFKEYSMDEFYDKSERDSDVFGPLRNDVLLKNILVIKECLNHIKTYKPFWCETIPTLDTSESNYSAELNPDTPFNHSFYYWFTLKQKNNRPEIAINDTYDIEFIRDNKPPVSEETFTSYTQPTVTRSEKIYYGFLGSTDQYDNHELSDITNDNKMYTFDGTEPITYDPVLNYNIISLNHDDNGEQVELNENITAYIEGDPYTRSLYVNKNGDTLNNGYHNYIVYKTSEVHKLYFSSTFKNVDLSETYDLCNEHGLTEIFYYTYNGVKFIITMVSLLDENGDRVEFDNGTLYVVIKNNQYYVKNSSFTKKNGNVVVSVNAAAALFTLKVVPGQAQEEETVDISVSSVHNTATVVAEFVDLGLVQYIPAPVVSTVPFGGILTSTSDSVNYIPVEQAGGVIEVYALPIVLPTVSMNLDFNDQNNKFSFENNHVDTTVGPNVTRVMYEWSTQQYKEYDATKSYAVWSYSLLNGSLVGQTGFSVEPLTSGGQTIIQCLNSTSKNITASYCFIAVCSSSDATVITVYDSSNNPYNAFKYTSDGTDYYYVLDGTQTDWTDDLSSIGYKLPTIGYLSPVKTAMSMNAGALEPLYDENGTKMTVSTYGISYPAVRVYSFSSDTTGTAVVNNNWTVHGPQFGSGDLSVSNSTGSTQTIQRIAFIK